MPKPLYLRELRPRARALLRQGRLPADLAAHEEKIAGPCPFRAPELDSLLARFRSLRDPRRGHGLRQRQPFVLAGAAVATLLGASGRTDGKPLQLFSAVSHRLRLTLAQLPIAEQSNESPALPQLLHTLPKLEGTRFTADALHCQQESARVACLPAGRSRRNWAAATCLA